MKTIDQYATEVLAAIDDHIAEGVIPAGVTDYSTLHECVDANQLLLDAGVPYGDQMPAGVDPNSTWVDVEEEVQRRLRERVTAKVTLHQTAPWNRRLTNPYRTRYAQAGGRYFMAEADSLNSPWTVWEIEADGGPLNGDPGAGIVHIAFNLGEVRAAIRCRAAGQTEEQITAAVKAVGRQGTGRNHPRNVERRRAYR